MKKTEKELQKVILNEDTWIELHEKEFGIEPEDKVKIRVSHRCDESEATKTFTNFKDVYKYINLSSNKTINFRITVEKRHKRK